MLGFLAAAWLNRQELRLAGWLPGPAERGANLNALEGFFELVDASGDENDVCAAGCELLRGGQA